VSETAKPATAQPAVKLLIELGPLLAFLLTLAIAGIMWATGVLMVAAVLALAASWHVFGRIAAIPAVTAVLVEAINLTQEGWRRLTTRWIFFFLGLALLNEIVWRNFSDAVWGTFKALGILSLTALFAMAQIGLIKRYAADGDT